MKRLFFVGLFVSSTVALLNAQTFTKITTGSVVNDGGASRSVNWVDYDNDRFLDLFVSNGKEGGEANFLYRNNRNGTFTKVLSDPIVTVREPYDGASWADIDGDGYPDCFVVAWYDSNNTYFHNNGNGSFTKVDIGAPFSDRGFSETASWGDYDNDGRLDLYVTNSGSPTLGAKKNFLYHNTANGFVKIDTGVVVTDQFYSRGANWVDYDNDGDLDLFVVNERNQTHNLYRNMLKETGTAWFQKVTSGAIVTDIASSVSASWGDYDNDGDLDVFVANGWPYAQNDFLYVNNGDGTFTKITDGDAVNDNAFSETCAWGDFDNDGDLDLFVTTAYSGVATKNLLYKNMLMETGTPALVKITAGDIVNDTGYSYGCSWGDYDRDGNIDLFVAKTFNENENNALYHNDNANGNHWLLLNCTGDVSNRSGIGTKVLIKATINGHAVWQMRAVDGQSGYCGQNLQLHFGLGNATSIDSMRVEWPSGINEVYTNVSVNHVTRIIENGGITSVGDITIDHPVEFSLEQNYPNPFNPKTTIVYRNGIQTPVHLAVIDQLGRNVATLVNETALPGEHSVDWDASFVASGVYYYRLRAGSFMETRKMIVLR